MKVILIYIKSVIEKQQKIYVVKYSLQIESSKINKLDFLGKTFRSNIFF